jgi:hypothetical protein
MFAKQNSTSDLSAVAVVRQWNRKSRIRKRLGAMSIVAMAACAWVLGRSNETPYSPQPASVKTKNVKHELPERQFSTVPEEHVPYVNAALGMTPDFGERQAADLLKPLYAGATAELMRTIDTRPPVMITAGVTAVPEPGSIYGLGLLGATALLLQRRRRNIRPMEARYT